MLDQQLGRSEALFVFKMVGDHRLAGMKRITGRGSQIGTDARRPDDARIPPDPRAHQETVLGRHVFQDLAIFRVQPLGRQPCRVIQKIGQSRALKRQHAKLSENLLLPDSLSQRAFRHVIGMFGSRLNDGIALGIVGRWWCHGKTIVNGVVAAIAQKEVSGPRNLLRAGRMRAQTMFLLRLSGRRAHKTAQRMS